MKLIEHNILPALLYFRLRIFTVYKVIGYYACRLTIKQCRFGTAVILLNGRIITVRSQIPCLQLITDRNFRLYITEKSAYRAIRNIIILTCRGQSVYYRHLLLSGRAAVICNAEDNHKVILRIFAENFTESFFFNIFYKNLAALSPEPIAANGRAVQSHPVKQRFRQFLMCFVRSPKNIISETAPPQNLRKLHIMTEGIDIEYRVARFSEMRFQILPGIKTLSDIAFAAGCVAVGLHPPALAQFPATFLYTFFNFFKKFYIGFFYPFEYGGSTEAVNKIGIFVHSVKRGAKCGAY